MKTAPKPWHNRLIRHLREWHRRLGIIAAFFLIFLSMTGIALNHTNALSLAHQPITSSWLLDHYGINPPSDLRFYQQNKLVVTDNLVWFGEQLLLESDHPIITMGKFQQFLFVLTKQQITLYNLQGELVDHLDSSSGLPDNIENASISGDQFIVKTPQGYFQTDVDFFEWRRISTLQEPNWLSVSTASAEQQAQAILAYKSQFLTLERIIVDAHSGRIFGLIGVLFMDLVGLLLILLSISGLYIWIRYARSKR